MHSWIINTKSELLKAETENINSRLLQWQTIVNECTKNEYISAFKTESADLIDLPPHKHLTTDRQMNEFLLLILNWNGINNGKTTPTKLPSTLKGYQHKAKNQINGSRAKHYSRTLYPYMIDCAESYANNISKMLFINFNKNTIAMNDNFEIVSNCRNIQEQCALLFYDILIYSYLVQLCQCRLRVTKQGRRVYLLCDNSIIGHKSNITTKMFQKYAKDHPYIDQFPSHREEAIDYFNKQKSIAYRELFMLYQKRKTVEITNENQWVNNIVRHGENSIDIMAFIKQNCKSADGKRVNIHKDTFNVLMGLVNTLEKEQSENNETIGIYQEYIERTQTKQMQIQQRNQIHSQQTQHHNQMQIQQHTNKDYSSVNSRHNGYNNGYNNEYNNGYNNGAINSQFEYEIKNHDCGCQMSQYQPTIYRDNSNEFEPYNLPSMTPNITNFGSIKSFNVPYLEHETNINELNHNNNSSHDIINEFECDSIIMNSTPICASMSIDNNLLFNACEQNNQNNNDEFIHHTYDNLNDIEFNYDDMDIVSYNIV